MRASVEVFSQQIFCTGLNLLDAMIATRVQRIVFRLARSWMPRRSAIEEKKRNDRPAGSDQSYANRNSLSKNKSCKVRSVHGF